LLSWHGGVISEDETIILATTNQVLDVRQLQRAAISDIILLVIDADVPDRFTAKPVSWSVPELKVLSRAWMALMLSKPPEMLVSVPLKPSLVPSPVSTQLVGTEFVL